MRVFVFRKLLIFLHVSHFLLDFSIASNSSARLMSDLLTAYPKFIRPVENDTTITIVKHRMTPVQMIEVIWTDDYLRWDPSLYGNTTEIRVPIHLIWQPDITLVESVSRTFQRHFDTDVIVNFEGRVTALQPYVMDATCKIDSLYFPFDEQVCSLTFNSWINPISLIDLEPDPASNTDNFVSNGEWELVAMEILKRYADQVYYVNEPFAEVKYRIHLKRRSLFYILNIMFPFFLTCALVAVSFYLPSESGERITLCVTSILAQFVFLEIITQHMPPNSENVALLQKYFFASISGVAVSALVTAWTLNMHFQSCECKPVPNWLKKVAFYYFAPIICLDMHHRRRKGKQIQHMSSSKRLSKKLASSPTAPVSCKNCNHANNSTELCFQYDEVHATDVQEENSTDDRVQYTKSRHQHNDNIMREWQEVAKIMDRMYFLIYMCAVIGMVVGFTMALSWHARNQNHDE
uniref:Neuronal acetylcholine receptor subunit alpha-9-like n=1 Tax=Saccoglossus kowalevskii TaxID=10224 RepID=A0ABM0MWF4_SACKO|nr:PREDICTED: neuronal acetylcholine receptor subunit alpha-9-like [Saccoglossus kowalevskii]